MASFGLASELDEPPQGGLQSSKHGRPAAASAGKTEAVDLGRFASRIQATYRGHAVRKSMESEGILPTKHAPRSQDAKKMDTGIRAHYGPASSSVTAHQERGMLSTGRSRQLDTPSSTSRVGSQPSHASSGGKALSKQPAAEEEYYATKIQSAYRGHAVRRSLSSSPEGGRPGRHGHAPFSEEDSARRIQAVYRGHAVRKTLQQDPHRQLSSSRTPLAAGTRTADLGTDEEYGLGAEVHRDDRAGAARSAQQAHRGHAAALTGPSRPQASIQHRAEPQTTADPKREEARLIHEWERFAERQADRFAPLSVPISQRRMLAESQGHRVRLLALSGVPMYQAEGRTFEFRVGVTLFDKGSGQFFGNTCISTPVPFDKRKAGSRQGVRCNLSFDLYFHSRLVDSQCMAVVDVVLVERLEDGVIDGEYSAGWAMLPLLPPPLKSPQKKAVERTAGVMMGTPRYLLFQGMFLDQAIPAQPLVSEAAPCLLTYTVEPYPAATAFAALVPEDFLITYSDVVPGLQRFNPKGQSTVALVNISSTLASPLLVPTFSIVLHSVRIALPHGFGETLEVLLTGSSAAQHSATEPTARGPPLEAYGDCFAVRLGVHNGRTFVGDPVVTHGVTLQPRLLAKGKWPRPQPVLNWRGLMEQSGFLNPSAPSVSFCLEPSGQPSAPPTRPTTPRMQQAGDDESAAAPADHQLARLAADIQRQLDQLSRAVTNLHKGRASLQSFGEEPEHRHSLHGRDHNRSGFEDDPDPFAPANGHASEAGRLMHLTHLRAMAPTAAHGDERLFSGAPEAVLKQPHSPTRAMRARLVEAGATDSLPSGVNDLLRQQRQAASPPERLVLGLEIADPRTVNDVIIQLLAYKPQDAVNAPTTLRSMYFTLQFYDCPPTSTEPAALAPAYGHDDTLILKPHEKHNGDDAPAGAGVVLKFRVDPVGDGEDMSAGGMEDRLVHFCRYLATRSLSIDVWDGDSLLQVGSMSVDLRGLLRQGREFSESLLELPVYDLQDPVASSAAPHTAAAAAGPSTAAPDMLPRGLLVMRLINIGQKSDLAASVMAANVASRSGDRDRGTPGRTKRVRVRAATHTNSVLARELTGVDPNILAQMAAARSPSLSPGSPAHTLSHSPLQASLAQHSMRQQILETLADIEHARSRHKADAIRQQLRDAMSSHCIVRPAYGETVMFEHEFTNPLLTEAVYQLQISHPQELAVVTDPQEWRALQAMQPAGTIRGRPLEDAVLDGDRLYLAAGETLAIPFRLRNLRHTGPATWRTVTAELLTLADQRPVAVLQVDVRPKPLVIDRTLRLAHVEHEVLHQALPVLQPPAQVQRIAEPGWEQPAASSSAQGPLGKDAVLIKFKCGGAPETSQFYLVLYRDAFRLQPVAVWLVYVHALRRVDLTGMVGQSSQSSVVVRGRPASATRVACFSSHPDELQVAPAEFTLPAGGLAELLLSFRPLHPGSLRATVHVVDMEARQLVHALLVVTESQAPPISRAFGVDLPAGGHSAKRITFTNPFSQRRTFYLRSSLSALLRVAPGQLDMAPHETKSVGMTFDTTKTAAGQYDVLVFVNDAADKNVECFKVRVSVV
ncbi:hypothetical protein WJX72_004791 [[Myrmecia] bisecta]|uniref:Nephrocystin-4 n=1 Tax=[Myrmecia] bisecta TaxID=41462 RepID=A0AAW1QQK6_9CHLO